MTSDSRANRLKIDTYRHSVAVRVTHWINVICFAVLLMSGLQIFNAHPGLYWGQVSVFNNPWLVMTSQQEGSDLEGVTAIGGHIFRTTGLFGASSENGQLTDRGFPSWATLPSIQDLATGRRWHFFFAWVFVANGAVYLAYALFGRHLRRDLLPDRHELRTIGSSLLEHVRLQFPRGPEARSYNVLQKLTYLAVIFALLPTMILTGLTMSPAIDAVAPFLLDLFGGRQSARSIHFICATLLVIFLIVHVVMVLLSGVWNNMRAMITGHYKIETDGEA
jgi:thiosulfate reductase cytochrome b subunit